MFSSWSRPTWSQAVRSQPCGDCVNYSGTQQAAGFCRVWGAVVVQPSPLSRQCPHWSSRQVAAPGCNLSSELA